MNPQLQSHGESAASTGFREVVIVDSSCDQYGDFVRAAREGKISLHFCVDGRSAMRLSERRSRRTL